MELRSLRYFLAVVQHGSLNRAATALHLSQPALSRAITGLEHEVGFSLFLRKPRGVALTDDGARLLEPARRVLADVDLLLREADDVRSSVGGRLTVGVTVSLTEEVATLIISELVESAPRIRVSSRGLYHPEQGVDEVVAGSYDVAIVGGDLDTAVPGARFERLYVDRVVVGASRDSELGGAGTVRARDLAGQPFIAETAGSPLRLLLDEYVVEHGVRIVTEVAYRHAMLPMVAHGTGYALMPAAMLRLAGRTDIVPVALEPEVPIPIWFVTRPTATTATALFAKAARDVTRRLEL